MRCMLKKDLSLVMTVLITMLTSVLNAQTPRFVVTDFSIEPHCVYSRDEAHRRNDKLEYHKSAKRLSGWWVVSKELFYNENIGLHARQILADKLSCYFTMISQSQLESVLADKREVLSKELNLSGADLTRAVAKLSPTRLANDVGGDVVVTGRFVSVDTRSNRFFGGVASPIVVEISAYDVKSRVRWFCKTYKSYGLGKSQYGNFDQMSNKIARDIKLVWDSKK